MTRNELKKLVRQCLCEVYLNIDEGAILNAQDTAENIRDKFKQFYTSSEAEIAKQNPFDGEYTKESIEKLEDWINRQFFYKLYKNESPVVIMFGELSSNVDGVYRAIDGGKSGAILLNTFRFLVTKSGDKYKIIPPNEFDYDEFSTTLEHELMHAEQHSRSGKLFSVVKGGQSNDPEIKKMIADKSNKPASFSDEEYAKYVNYYNLKVELNTHAKDVANRYVKWWTDMLKKNNGSFTADQVKALVSNVFTNPQEANNKFYLNHLLSLFSGYIFLTPKNRNKWWNYVYKTILGMKYSGVNESVKCPKCGGVNEPGSKFCAYCGTKLN